MPRGTHPLRASAVAVTKWTTWVVAYFIGVSGAVVAAAKAGP